MKNSVGVYDFLVTGTLGSKLGSGGLGEESPSKWCILIRAVSYTFRSRTFITPKLVNLRTSIPSSWTPWPSIHSNTVRPGFNRE